MIAAYIDEGAPMLECADVVLQGDYPGYALAVNELCKLVLENDPDCSFCVTGGDDVLPDTSKTPEEIALELIVHFRGTFGVMQPIGGGHGIETICGSPWMGRDFCERAYGGNGPLWHEYTHNFVDNELQDVAKRLGALWQRPDLTHQHNNWMWTTGVRPKFLDAAYSRFHWDKAMAIYQGRRGAGFPGHEPISAMVRNLKLDNGDPDYIEVRA
jgi:hypothetical protein